MSDAPRAGIYLRVSSERQETANQRPAVLQLCKARGYEIVRVYDETASTLKKRPVFDRMMVDAHRGEFQVLVTWAIDRLGRDLLTNINAVRRLSECGVRVVSVQETWLDTGGPVADLLLCVFSWLAESERRRIGERSKAAIERARANGIRIGRPPVQIDVAAARALIDSGVSYRKAARRLGIGTSTLHRILAADRVLAAASATRSGGDDIEKPVSR